MKHIGRIVGGIIVVVGLRVMSTYNGMISGDVGVQTQRAKVESAYQRRADLIPNLVSTVKGFAAQEKDVFIGVTEARAKATQSNININDAKALAEYQQSQSQVSSALSRLLVVSENYPQLKSDQNFLNLQVQLEGTENRIKTERDLYNDSVATYNVRVRTFPGNMLAGVFGFSAKTPFQGDASSNKAPAIDFGVK